MPRFENFDGGLIVTPPADKIPDNALYYARGVHRLARGSIVSRQGSTQLHASTEDVALGSAGMFYWNDAWFYGTSNSIYQGSTCISSGTHDGSRITFCVGAPTAGVADALFVAGGATNTLYKIDTSNTVTAWGITPPGDTLLLATGGAGGYMTTGSTYSYRLTYYNSHTGSRSDPMTTSSDVVLLIHCTGAHNSTAFTDSSTRSHTITSTGNAVVSTATVNPFGDDVGVMYIDGTTNSYVQVADSPVFAFGEDPFTISMRVKLLSTATLGCIFSQNETAGAVNYHQCWWHQTDHKLRWRLYVPGGGTPLNTSASWAPTTGTWYHLAFIRGWGGNANTLAITVDGTLLHSTTIVGLNFSDIEAPFRFGYYDSSGAGLNQALNGYMDEIRVVAGSAEFKEPFTPLTVRYGAAPVVVTGDDDTTVDLSNIPTSTDSQVTHVEVWRTQGGGATYYLAARIENSTDNTTFTDTVADTDLGVTELPTDNLKPYYWFDDCMVHNAAMFWITRTQAGEKGRVYYSPIGRLEVVSGFINVTDDGEPLQKLVKYGAGLGVLSDAGFYEILGTDPYYPRRVAGVPGTNEPHSVAVTPYGVAYEAADGPRLLAGGATRPLAAGAVEAVFQGEDRGQLVAWGTGTMGEYARDEYVMANTATSQTLAVNLRSGRWRDLGLSLGVLHYDEQNDTLAGAHVASSAVYEIEKEGETDDSGTGIEFAIETKHIKQPRSDRKVLVRGAIVDALAPSTMDVKLIYDSTYATLDNLQQSTRAMQYFPVNKWVSDVGLRISSTISVGVEIFGIELDVYVSEG